MKITIIGTGNVGSALQKGLVRAGHEVRGSGKGKSKEDAAWADLVILAVPFGAIQDVAIDMGNAV